MQTFLHDLITDLQYGPRRPRECRILAELLADTWQRSKDPSDLEAVRQDMLQRLYRMLEETGVVIRYLNEHRTD